MPESYSLLGHNKAEKGRRTRKCLKMETKRRVYRLTVTEIWGPSRRLAVEGLDTRLGER